MIVEEIFASLGFKVDRSSIKNLNGQMSGMIATAKDRLLSLRGVLAGAGIGAAFHQVASVADSLDALDENAKAAGLTAQAYRQLTEAGALAGVSTETFSSSMAILATNLDNAQQGSAEAIKVFRNVGLSAQDISGGTLEDVLPRLLDAFAAMPDGIRKTAALRDVFGRSGAALSSFVAGGSEGLDKFKREFDAIGGVITDEQLRQGSDFNDSWAKLKLQLSTLRRDGLAPLIPVFRRVIETATSVLGSLTNVVRRIKEWASVGTRLETFTSALKLIAVAAGIALAPLLVLFLAVEDFIAFIQGKDSLFGEFLNTLFGEGSVETIRSFFTKLASIDTFGALFSMLQEGIVQALFGSGTRAQILDNWDVLTKALIEDAKNLAKKIIGPILNLTAKLGLNDVVDIPADVQRDRVRVAAGASAEQQAAISLAGLRGGVAAAKTAANNVVVSPTINVSVAAGTPDKVARDIANKAGKSTTAMIRSASDALIPEVSR